MTNQTPESALPPSSQGAGSGQPSSPNQEAFTDAQLAQLQRLIENQWQSGKDRRIAQHEEKLSDLDQRLARYEELRAKGMNPDQVRQQMDIEELLLERRSGRQPQVLPQGSGEPQGAQEVSFMEIYETLEVNPNDNEVINLTVKHAKNPTALKAALVDYKASKRNQPPPPASAVTTNRGIATTQSDKDRLMQEYQSELSKIKRGPQGATAIANLKIKYKRLGLTTLT